MKNEKEFKKRISEIAARIAEESDSPNKSSQPDAEKVKEIISGITRAKEALGRINTATELGDVMMGLMSMMSLDPTQFINGLNRAVKLAAEFKQKNNPSEPVDPDSANAVYDGVPKNKLKKSLAEAYERIKRK
jgi:methyl-accepting chemotaxis protein